MKLSVLDQSPISDGMDEKGALDATIALAKIAEEAGYERVWVTEHHDLYGLASPNPAILISSIAAQTVRIKVGAGAVLLPYYKAFHIAETYHMLATMYPGRIDLGIGRAPGGPAEASLALSDNYLAEVRHYPERISELLSFIGKDTTKQVTATPVPAIPPETFLLGTSEKSALLAAEKGMSYAFGHFMTDKKGPEIIQQYKAAYQGEGASYTIIAIDAICAATTEEAEKLAQSVLIWRLRQDDILAKQTVPTTEEANGTELTEAEENRIKKMRKQMIIGNPDQVKAAIDHLQAAYQADEMMIVTIVHDPAAKRRSYELIASAYGM